MYQKLERKITLLTQDAAQYLDFNTILSTDNIAEIQPTANIAKKRLGPARRSYTEKIPIAVKLPSKCVISK